MLYFGRSALTYTLLSYVLVNAIVFINCNNLRLCALKLRLCAFKKFSCARSALPHT